MKQRIPESLECDSFSTPLLGEEFDKVVLTRRSVRIYNGEPIPEEVMQHCFKLALLSPSSVNLQPWEFHWVRNKDLRQDLVKCCYSQPSAKTAAELIVCVARQATWPSNLRQLIEHLKTEPKTSASAIDYHENIVPKMLVQGHFGFFGYLRAIKTFFKGFYSVQSRRPGGPSDMLLWAVKSTTLAIQTFMLSLRAHGYDSCPMEGFDEKRVAKLLSLPNDAHIVMVVSAGKRASNGVYGRRFRLEESQFIKIH